MYNLDEKNKDDTTKPVETNFWVSPSNSTQNQTQKRNDKDASETVDLEKDNDMMLIVKIKVATMEIDYKIK